MNNRFQREYNSITIIFAKTKKLFLFRSKSGTK
mgnify:CR=1 FL=1